MKLVVFEREGCFEFVMEPESMKDCAVLARIAKNAIKEVRAIGADAFTDHTMSGYVVIGKRKQTESQL